MRAKRHGWRSGMVARQVHPLFRRIRSVRMVRGIRLRMENKMSEEAIRCNDAERAVIRDIDNSENDGPVLMLNLTRERT